MIAQNIIDRFPNECQDTIEDTFPLIENSISCYYGGSFDNDCNKERLLLLAMHLILVENMSSTETFQSVASQSVGGISVSYNAVSSTNVNDNFFQTTKYGQQFSKLSQYAIGAYFV